MKTPKEIVVDKICDVINNRHRLTGNIDRTDTLQRELIEVLDEYKFQLVKEVDCRAILLSFTKIKKPEQWAYFEPVIKAMQEAIAQSQQEIVLPSIADVRSDFEETNLLPNDIELQQCYNYCLISSRNGGQFVLDKLKQLNPNVKFI